MEHVITAKKTTVTDSIRAYIEKRFSKFEKYIDRNVVVHTKIEVKDNGNRHKVEVTIPFGKKALRAEVNDTDMYVAIDEAERVMSRLLKKRKEKRVQRWQQGAEPTYEAAEAPETDENVYDINRVKRHELLPMTAQEACEAMDMIGHKFYVYLDSENGSTCAVYKRDDGNYGQLIYT